jgi:hypothetical protein
MSEKSSLRFLTSEQRAFILQYLRQTPHSTVVQNAFTEAFHRKISIVTICKIAASHNITMPGKNRGIDPDIIIKGRDKGMTYQEIGSSLGLTRSGAWKIMKRRLTEAPTCNDTSKQRPTAHPSENQLSTLKAA